MVNLKYGISIGSEHIAVHISWFAHVRGTVWLQGNGVALRFFFLQRRASVSSADNDTLSPALFFNRDMHSNAKSSLVSILRLIFVAWPFHRGLTTTTFLIGFVTPLIFDGKTGILSTPPTAPEAALSDAPPSANKLDVKLRRSKRLI